MAAERKRRGVGSAVPHIDYQLHSLGWKAFQDLCLVVLSEVLGQPVQAFNAVHDGGRDGAFGGAWVPQPATTLSGETVVQCKFTATPRSSLSAKALAPELEKCPRLATAGYKNYVLLTNYSVGGSTELELRSAFADAGFAHFVAYGNEWLSGQISALPRLRRLVPRVYGLGDLSEILDERVYEQTARLLAAERDNLTKFVPTDAYRGSVAALEQHGFVLLLGRAAAGKSTIAATVALAAPDAWDCTPVKIERLEHFKEHWNPNSPGQLFWIDDVFGPTQYLSSRAHEWNSLTPFIRAAVKGGCKIIATSRDYVYHHARADLKRGAFPLLTESQVVIDVESLSQAEREQILYNHIKLGNQSQEFKKAIKRFLPELAAIPQFQPEVARRLGNREFTKTLRLVLDELVAFVERPHEFLKDVIENLSPNDKAALATIFVHGGGIASPVELTDIQVRTLERLGATEAAVLNSLNAMRDSLVRLSTRGETKWTFQHPTIADAFAEVVAENPELTDVYLEGVAIDVLLEEITCGTSAVENAKICVPSVHFDVVIRRLTARLEEINALRAHDYNATWHMKRALFGFLSARCSTDFLHRFFAAHPDLVERCTKPGSYLGVVPETDLLIVLMKNGMLTDDQRQRAIRTIASLAVQTPDADFLRISRLRELLTADELLSIMSKVETELVGDLDREIDSWDSGYSSSDDPDEYYGPYVEALEAYRDELAGCPVSSRILDKGIERLKHLLTNRMSDHVPKDEPSDLTLGRVRETPVGGRSIFDDVDR